MSWNDLFVNMDNTNFFNFSFLPKYGSAFVRGFEYTLLLAVVSVLLAVIPALLLASRFVEGRGVGLLSSVTGRLRMGWLGRSLLLALAVFVVYFAVVLGWSARNGGPVDLSDLYDLPRSRQVLELATTRIMDAVTALVAELREEAAPAQRWSFRSHRREPVIRELPSTVPPERGDAADDSDEGSR